ncbi:MAG: hypothetical protein JNL28_00755 [Planctomycetes bacterium]|nr:hypothetical protein [Planctomycetota bacterium]
MNAHTDSTASSATRAPSPDADGARAGWWIFLAALVLRVIAVFVLHSTDKVHAGAWDFGYEAACIARSLYDGEGFAGPWTRAVAPWDLGSGATGWLCPIYPGLVAGALHLGGGLTSTAALILFLIQSLISSATCVLVLRLGRALGAARAGLLAAWVLVFLPASIWNASHTVWDTTLATFALVSVTLAVFAWRRAGLAAFAGLGAALGLALLVNAALLALLPAWLWAVWRARSSAGACAARLAVAAVAMLVVLMPWLWRNQQELGVLKLRTNLGVELAVGNNDAANGRFQVSRHPSNSAAEFLRYRALGESAYNDVCLAEGREWIANHPERFTELCLLRATMFWFGVNPLVDERVDDAGRTAASDLFSWIKYMTFLAVGVLGLAGAIVWAGRAFEGRFLLGVFAVFPLVYYFVHALERYRFPIEPLLVLSAAWFALDLRARWQARSVSSSR